MTAYESRPQAASETPTRSDAILPPAPDLERLADISHAFGCGYDLGHAHGYARGYAARDDELRRAHAGQIVAAIADLPEADPALAAARDAARARRRWAP